MVIYNDLQSNLLEIFKNGLDLSIYHTSESSDNVVFEITHVNNTVKVSETIPVTQLEFLKADNGQNLIVQSLMKKLNEYWRSMKEKT
jgi:hypothetical protein